MDINRDEYTTYSVTEPRVFNSILAINFATIVIATPSLAASQAARDYAQNALDLSSEWSFQGNWNERIQRITPYREEVFKKCFYTDNYSDEACREAADALLRIIYY